MISTHGISGWRPLVFGSIAEKVVKLVQCPILLLRSYGMIRRENFNDRQEVKIGRSSSIP